MSHLLVLNLAMDSRDPSLGFVPEWTSRLAERFDRVSVVTMRAAECSVSSNVKVWSLGKECGRSEPARLLAFYRTVGRIALRDRPDVCFAHMTPLFALLAAPVLKVRGVPLVLWYAHGSVTWTVRWASRVADRCLTSTHHGFAVPSVGAIEIGQGIDTARFAPQLDVDAEYDWTFLTVGRISSRKGLGIVLEAFARLHRETHAPKLLLAGAPAAPGDVAYQAHLEQETERLGLAGRVEFLGHVPFDEVQTLYGRAGFFVNASSTGSLDKAILEAMASGCIPISANDSFRDLANRHGWSRLAPAPDADGLAEAMAFALGLDRDARTSLRHEVRQVVIEDHDLDRLMDLIAGHLRDLSRGTIRTLES